MPRIWGILKSKRCIYKIVQQWQIADCSGLGQLQYIVTGRSNKIKNKNLSNEDYTAANLIYLY